MDAGLVRLNLAVDLDMVLEFWLLEPFLRKLEGEWTEFLAEGPKVEERM